eukprot:COSAG03_NODE_999_length_5060_cov_5.775448_9_plen_124_part_00
MEIAESHAMPMRRAAWLRQVAGIAECVAMVVNTCRDATKGPVSSYRRNNLCPKPNPGFGIGHLGHRGSVCEVAISGFCTALARRARRRARAHAYRARPRAAGHGCIPTLKQRYATDRRLAHLR